MPPPWASACGVDPYSSPNASAPVLKEACNCGSSQMQELLHGTTMTAPPTATMSNCSWGGNGERWGWGQQGEGWQQGRTNDREGDGRDNNDNSREVEEKDKDGTRTGWYQAPPPHQQWMTQHLCLPLWATACRVDHRCYIWHWPLPPPLLAFKRVGGSLGSF